MDLGDVVGKKINETYIAPICGGKADMMEQWLGPTGSHELILIQGLGEPVKFLSSGAQRRNKVNSLSEAETLHKFNHSFLPGR